MSDSSEKGTTVLRHIERLIERTKNLDYDPSREAWVCGDHGEPECAQGTCGDLPWPKPNGDPVLAAFTGWAESEFRRIVRPYDEGRAAEMPDDAFLTYSVWEWPVGALVEARPTPPGSGQPDEAGGGAMSALVDPQRFCGQQQAHGPHRWVMASGMTGFYAVCAGKACDHPPTTSEPHRSGPCWCGDHHDREDFL